ncbi:MAG: hypothetical protein WDO24_13845 [Pseudomonadota bacterium]
MLTDCDADPSIPSADIIELATARRRREPEPPIAPLAALCQAAAALVARSCVLERQATALADCFDGLERVSRHLASESLHAQAIAQEAERIAAAIDAGDLDGLCVLRDEALRRRADRAR